MNARPLFADLVNLLLGLALDGLGEHLLLGAQAFGGEVDFLRRREPAALGDALACLLELVAVHVFLELTAQAAFAGSAEVGVVSPLELVPVLLALGAGLQLELMFDLVALLF